MVQRGGGGLTPKIDGVCVCVSLDRQNAEKCRNPRNSMEMQKIENQKIHGNANEWKEMQKTMEMQIAPSPLSLTTFSKIEGR